MVWYISPFEKWCHLLTSLLSLLITVTLIEHLLLAKPYSNSFIDIKLLNVHSSHNANALSSAAEATRGQIGAHTQAI